MIIATLLPENINKRNELANLKKLVDQAPECQFLIGTAYHSVIERVETELSNFDNKIVFNTNFIYNENMNEKRGHEISCGKRAIATFLQKIDYNYCFFYDADVEIKAKDFIRYQDERIVTKFPYVMRDKFSLPVETFGVYLHSKSVVTGLPNYPACFYTTYTKDGKLYRNAAPDCAFRATLINAGVSIRTATDVTTKHWTGPSDYRQFSKGYMSNHMVVDSLNFCPVVKDSMPMDIASLVALKDFFKETVLNTAIEIGTGQGNGTNLLLDLGLLQINTFDESYDYLKKAKVLLEQHPRVNQCNIDFGKVKLENAGSYYFGRNLPEVDIAVIDGPINTAIGRVKTAAKIKSKIYVFHDYFRDKKYIDQFPAKTRIILETSKGVAILFA